MKSPSYSQHLNSTNDARIQLMTITKSLVVAICLGTACISSSPWPSSEEWSQLNSTVNGRLFASMPLSRPCFSIANTRGNFNLAQCSIVQDHYSDKCEWFGFNPVSISLIRILVYRVTQFSAYMNVSTPMTTARSINSMILDGMGDLSINQFAVPS